MSEQAGKLGILAGKGDLPREIAAACQASGRDCCIIAFEGNTSPQTLVGYDHVWVSLGSLGPMFEALHAHGVTDLVLAGRIERPKLSTLRPDAKAAKLLAKLGTSLFAGDDRLLRNVTSFLEEEGFRVVGADSVLTDALAPHGVIGKHQPQSRDREDMEKAYKIAKIVGEHDIGQAVIVCDGHVLGVEALEGTDQLIARCANLRPDESTRGVLVKAKKPKQERRADLPAIGISTVEHIRQAGFVGIGLEAGETLILSRRETIDAADAAGIFLYGLSGDGL